MSHHNSINVNLPQKVNLEIRNQSEAVLDTAILPTKLDDKFLISGQGSLVFRLSKKGRKAKSLSVVFSTPLTFPKDHLNKEIGQLKLTISPTYAKFQYRKDSSGEWQDFELRNGKIHSEEKYQENRAKGKIDKKEGIDNPIVYPKDLYSIGIDPNEECLYWISVDALNKRLLFGKGEMRHNTRLLDYKYDLPKNLFNKTKKRRHDFIENLSGFQLSKGIKAVTLWKDPVVVEPPVLVVSSKDFTMDIAAAGTATTASSLSKECQILYGNVADFELSTPDFPDFEQAIEYSIRTKGCIGNDILRKKLDSDTFGGKDGGDAEPKSFEEVFKEVYLRITLGQSQGESPGIPYVMEIWPSGCASPVHQHGSTHAIIKVLRGSINVDLFRMLPGETGSGKPFGAAEFHPGDVTYLMPEVNQFHLLKNEHKNVDTCITIQCYSYGQNDSVHHSTFDYNENHELGHFDPISDYDFIAFKAKVKEEWEEYLNSKFWLTYKPKNK